MTENYKVVARSGGRTDNVVSVKGALEWIAAAEHVRIQFRWDRTVTSVSVTKKAAREFLKGLGRVRVLYSHDLHLLSISEAWPEK